MSTKTHIIKSFDEELNQLRTGLAEMGMAAGVQIKYAVRALISRDCRLASEVIDNDSRVNMLQNVMEAYRELNVDTAVAVWHRDEEVNRIYADLLSRLRSYISVDIENLKTYTSLIFVARCCERIGDHIKNEAECVCYIQAGESFQELSPN